jgi:hypothetical protein
VLRALSARTKIQLQSAAYGLAVFLGTALLGFVIAPWLGTATGLFAIEAESSGFFSLLTLKGTPYLVALAVASGLLYPKLSARRFRMQLALAVLNVLGAWLLGASIALAILG